MFLLKNFHRNSCQKKTKVQCFFIKNKQAYVGWCEKSEQCRSHFTTGVYRDYFQIVTSLGERRTNFKPYWIMTVISLHVVIKKDERQFVLIK